MTQGSNANDNPLMEYMKSLVDLKKGMDREGTIAYIRNNRSVTGANAWLLLCSIIIACVGLNLNSPAVIIGGMLISPLMSPILGIGLGIAINDRRLLLNSLSNFGISILISLVGSLLYFSITPVVELTVEIKARTSPTLLDTFVAFFGGLAGIISISRKEMSNALPGVAIATALMPPLCVSGYGLATDDFGIFINSFYLFFLNSFFIAVSTFIMARVLDFPLRQYQDVKERRRTSWFIILFSLILILPSVHILYQVYTEVRTNQLIETQFVASHFGTNSNPRAIDWKVNNQMEPPQLMLEVYGRTLSPSDIDSFENMLQETTKVDMSLFVLQDRQVDVEKLQELQSEIESVQEFTENVKLLESEQNKLYKENKKLVHIIDSITDQSRFAAYTEELRILFPSLSHASLIKEYVSFSSDSIQEKRSIKLRWQDNKDANEYEKENERARAWMQQKMNLDSLYLHTE